MLLHETKKVIDSQSIVEEEVTQNKSIQSATIQPKTCLTKQPKTSPSSDIVRTNALLDCGADSTLVREDIAKIL